MKVLKQRFLSFKYAFQGLMVLFRSEPNSRIHLIATIGVVIAGFFFDLTSGEWVAILCAIGFVFTAELINSAIERTVDLITKEKHPLAKQAKDLAAGAVLVSAITAAIIGVIIFGPKLFALL